MEEYISGKTRKMGYRPVITVIDKFGSSYDAVRIAGGDGAFKEFQWVKENVEKLIDFPRGLSLGESGYVILGIFNTGRGKYERGVWFYDQSFAIQEWRVVERGGIPRDMSGTWSSFSKEYSDGPSKISEFKDGGERERILADLRYEPKGVDQTIGMIRKKEGIFWADDDGWLYTREGKGEPFVLVRNETITSDMDLGPGWSKPVSPSGDYGVHVKDTADYRRKLEDARKLMRNKGQLSKTEVLPRWVMKGKSDFVIEVIGNVHHPEFGVGYHGRRIYVGESRDPGDWFFIESDRLEKIYDPVLEKAPLTPPYQRLFNHMSEEHGLTLLQDEMSEIVRIIREMGMEVTADFEQEASGVWGKFLEARKNAIMFYTASGYFFSHIENILNLKKGQAKSIYYANKKE